MCLELGLWRLMTLLSCNNITLKCPARQAEKCQRLLTWSKCTTPPWKVWLPWRIATRARIVVNCDLDSLQEYTLLFHFRSISSSAAMIWPMLFAVELSQISIWVCHTRGRYENGLSYRGAGKKVGSCRQEGMHGEGPSGSYKKRTPEGGAYRPGTQSNFYTGLQITKQMKAQYGGPRQVFNHDQDPNYFGG